MQENNQNNQNNKNEGHNLTLESSLNQYKNELLQGDNQTDFIRFVEDMTQNTKKVVANLMKKIVDEYELPRNRSLLSKDSTFVQGDVHGGLKTFLNKLYLARMIDKDGNCIAKGNQKIIMLGDFLDGCRSNTGRYSIQSYFFSRALQIQRKDKVTIIFGNHEQKPLIGDKKIFKRWNFIQGLRAIPKYFKSLIALDFENIGNIWNIRTHEAESFQIIPRIIIKDVENHHITAAHSIGNSLYVHAGLSTDLSFQKMLSRKIKETRNNLNDSREATAKEVETVFNKSFIDIFSDNSYDCDKIKKSFNESEIFGNKKTSPAWTREYAHIQKEVKDLSDIRNGKYPAHTPKAISEKDREELLDFSKITVYAGHNPTKSDMIENYRTRKVVLCDVSHRDDHTPLTLVRSDDNGTPSVCVYNKESKEWDLIPDLAKKCSHLIPLKHCNLREIKKPTLNTYLLQIGAPIKPEVPPSEIPHVKNIAIAQGIHQRITYFEELSKGKLSKGSLAIL